MNKEDTKIERASTYESDGSNEQRSKGTRPCPPGCEEGGEWGKVKYRGVKTGAAACAGCFLFFVPGLLIAILPLDKKRVYKVENRLYDVEGKRVDLSVKKFKPVMAS